MITRRLVSTILGMLVLTLPALADPFLGVQTSITLNWTEGSNPPQGAIIVENSGDGTMNWSVVDDAAWLTLNPTSGTLPIGNVWSTYVVATVTWPGAGTHVANLTFTANAPNSPQYRTVTLNCIASVPDPPDLIYPPASGSEILWMDIPVNFQWNTSANATSYILQVARDNNFTDFAFNQNVGNTTQYSVSSLEYGTGYSWRVSAVNSSGQSDWSQVRGFWTRLAVPDLQSPPNGSTNLPLAVTVSWGSCTGATSYLLMVADNMNFNDPFFDDNVSNTTSYQLNDLSGNTTYFWKVAAVSPAGTTEYSIPWSFTTIASAPNTPARLSPNNGDVDVPVPTLFTWLSVNNATSYTLQVDNNSDFGSPRFDENVGNNTSYSVGNLDLGFYYYWRVRAHGSGGDSPWSTPLWGFTTEFPSELTVIYPNGGEVWTLGEEVLIEWTDNFDEDVTIELYREQFLEATIAEATASDGEYAYTPEFLTISSDYRVKISKVDEPAVNDLSDSTFTIQEPGPDLILSLSPYATELPPSGGWLYYEASVTNNGDLLTGLTYWTTVLLPNGNLYPEEIEHFGPFSLPAGFNNPSIQRQINVPAMAPSGEYVYTGMIGYHPNTTLALDSFSFTKSPNASNDFSGNVIWPILRGSTFLAGAAGDQIADLDVALPDEQRLTVHPSPFNPTTTVTVSLPNATELTVKVYSIDGRQVAALADGTYAAGQHQLVLDGSHLASGVYLIRATTGTGWSHVRKAILMK